MAVLLWLIAIGTSIIIGVYMFTMFKPRKKGTYAETPFVQSRPLLDYNGSRAVWKASQLLGRFGKREIYMLHLEGGDKLMVWDDEIFPAHGIKTPMATNTPGGRAVWIFQKTERDRDELLQQLVQRYTEEEYQRIRRAEKREGSEDAPSVRKRRGSVESKGKRRTGTRQSRKAV